MAIYYAVKHFKKKRREREAANGEPLDELDPTTQAAPHLPGAGVVDDGQSGVPRPSAGTTNTKETVSKSSKSKPELSPEEVAENKRRRKHRLKVLFGLVAPFTLQALDMTIVASALPFIAQDFNQIQQLNWIISSFNLASAAFLPFWAQMADIFGRHATIHATIIIMAVGSAICTGAPTSSYGVLLLGRALQGVGAAGVSICVRTILADGVSLKDYALNWTLFSLFSAVSFSIGPVVGGYLTQTSWRWCFAINLPVAVIAIILVILLLRKDLLGPQPLPELGESQDTSTRRGRFVVRLLTIDYGGQLLFLWGLGLLILAFTWAGSSYAWDSPEVLAPLVIGGVLTIAWLGYEYLMAPSRLMSRIFPLQRAMMPWELVSQRDIALLFYVNFCVGMAMFAVMYFMDLYFALVQGNSASKAGLSLLYFLPGLGVGAYMAMFMSNVWPRQTLPSIILGGVTSAIGITVLSWAVKHGNVALIQGMMALTGHGIGMRMNPGSLHGLAYFPNLTASVTCLVSFALPFGGTLGLTIMSTVFNNRSGVAHEDPKSGISWAFVSMIPFMWLCVVLTIFLGNVWIAKDGSHEVVNGPYLWSLMTGKKLQREKRTRGNGVGNVSGVEPSEEKGATNGKVDHTPDIEPV